MVINVKNFPIVVRLVMIWITYGTVGWGNRGAYEPCIFRGVSGSRLSFEERDRRGWRAVSGPPLRAILIYLTPHSTIA